MNMKNHLIDAAAGFLAGLLITFAATMIGFLNSGTSFWSSLVILDVAAFFSYAQFSFFQKRIGSPPSFRTLAVPFLFFSAGAAIAGFFVAYYIVYLFEHGSGVFL